VAHEVTLVEGVVYRANLDTYLVEALLYLCLILVIREGYGSVWYKDHFGYAIERFCNLVDGVFEIRLPSIGRIGN
jgi:hypothetical protein